MRKIFVSCLLVLLLTSCDICSTNENITPLWSDGMLTAECMNSTYTAQVHFEEGALSFTLSEPEVLDGVVFKVNENSVVLLKDDISLAYDANTINGFMSDFYKAYKVLNGLRLEYTRQGEVLTAEFQSDDKKCRVKLDKKTKRVFSLETAECVYTID